MCIKRISSVSSAPKRPNRPNEAKRKTEGEKLGGLMGKILQSLNLSIIAGLVLTVIVAVLAPLLAG